MGLRFQPRSLLTLCFIALFAYVVISSSEMPLQAKLYPWTIGIIALVLLAYQLVREILPPAKTETDQTGVDIDFSEEESSKLGKRRALELFAWMYGFALLLWLIGFYTAAPLMVLAYMLRHKETLVMTIALPVGTGVATWYIFGHLLHLPFPPGVLLEWAGLV
ncbi:MAG: tripartite tricarboxylate transporter TctB family protein [Alphaproteobacteria bacterium]